MDTTTITYSNDQKGDNLSVSSSNALDIQNELLRSIPVQICRKPIYNLNEESSVIFDGESVNFEVFIKGSNMWDDKSYLIQLFFYVAKVVVLTAPRQWDKTSNIEMLRTFFEIPIYREGNIENIITIRSATILNIK